MSTAILDQPITGPAFQGSVPASIPLPKPETDLSLLINASGINYKLEAPILDSPIIENGSIKVRFVVDDNVYLGLNLTGESLEQANEFNVKQFFLYYQIEDQRPRAHFVANTLMAVVGLAGNIDLKLSEPEVNTNLNVVSSLLEISKMLHRRQTAYRLMVIEEVTGTQFLLPPAISEREIDRIAFVYHAIIDRSFIWQGGTLETTILATPEFASQIAQVVQPFNWPLPAQPLSEILLGQHINLGFATVTMEDAIVKNLDEVVGGLMSGDGHQVKLEIHSRQDKYDFTEIPYSTHLSWEPKIQALINLESYLDAAITGRYHALAATTLEGLTEEEKKEVTASPDLDESFFIDIDEE